MTRQQEIDMVKLQIKRHEVRLALIGKSSSEVPRVRRAIKSSEAALQKLEGATFCQALDHSEGRGIIDQIDDYRASNGGEQRFAWEINSLVDELFEATGYRMEKVAEAA